MAILQRQPKPFDVNSLSNIQPYVSLYELVAAYREQQFAETGRRPDFQDALMSLDRLHSDLWDRYATEREAEHRREGETQPLPDDDFDLYEAWPVLMGGDLH